MVWSELGLILAEQTEPGVNHEYIYLNSSPLAYYSLAVKTHKNISYIENRQNSLAFKLLHIPFGKLHNHHGSTSDPQRLSGAGVSFSRSDNRWNWMHNS